MRGRRTTRISRRLWAAAPLLCAVFALAGCGDMGRLQTASPAPVSAPKPNRTVAQTPAAEREHERILSSYGGAYDDPKLEALIGKTVDRLVAALGSPRSGLQGDDPQFRRGQRLRASDRSALCDARPDRAGERHLGIVLGVEPRDWRMCWQSTPRFREDQARQAAIVTPRGHRHGATIPI